MSVRKMSMVVCVCLLCMCVLWGPPFEFAMVVPSVDSSAADLLCVLCV